MNVLYPPPFEGHIVAAARALEAAKDQVEQALVLLEYMPRDTGQTNDVFDKLEGRIAAARDAYATYAAILTCKGQA